MEMWLVFFPLFHSSKEKATKTELSNMKLTYRTSEKYREKKCTINNNQSYSQSINTDIYERRQKIKAAEVFFVYILFDFRRTETRGGFYLLCYLFYHIDGLADDNVPL